jgi:hypothetical protein
LPNSLGSSRSCPIPGRERLLIGQIVMAAFMWLAIDCGFSMNRSPTTDSHLSHCEESPRQKREGDEAISSLILQTPGCNTSDPKKGVRSCPIHWATLNFAVWGRNAYLKSRLSESDRGALMNSESISLFLSDSDLNLNVFASGNRYFMIIILTKTKFHV